MYQRTEVKETFVKQTETITRTRKRAANPDLVEAFRAAGVREGLWRRGDRFFHYCKHQLFRGIDFRGKTMLDVGCGDGLFMIWAAANGAGSVVGLEPLADGSGTSKRVAHILYAMSESLGLKNVSRLPYTFQEYDCRGQKHDIVLLHASINHLDEQMCVELQNSPEAQKVYTEIFRKLRGVMRKNGKLIIVDASNRNFYRLLGFKKNPVNPRLTWHNHQAPEFWADMLEQTGFGARKISWLSNAQLGPLGFVLRNRLMAYFTESAFRLEMTAL
ncbi:MAG: methyltransferase domain-containing protein [Calditrichaeota bacterium]|nr:MAG: methyltransferase domain-containing protein [Calditrichota bacterium]